MRLIDLADNVCMWPRNADATRFEPEESYWKKIYKSNKSNKSDRSNKSKQASRSSGVPSR